MTGPWCLAVRQVGDHTLTFVLVSAVKMRTTIRCLVKVVVTICTVSVTIHGLGLPCIPTFTGCCVQQQ